MSEMPPIRLIATDVDGTLLASNGKLPEDNRRAILAAQERGVIVAIASVSRKTSICFCRITACAAP